MNNRENNNSFQQLIGKVVIEHDHIALPEGEAGREKNHFLLNQIKNFI